MRQCQRCFVLNKQDAVRCVKCGTLLGDPAPRPAGMRLRSEPPLRRSLPPRSATAVVLPSASRGTVSKSLMYAIGLLLLFPVPLLLSLEWDGADARPGPVVEDRQLPPQDVRQQQIVEASALLQHQLDTLESVLRNKSGQQSAESREAALAEWQNEMERIKATYRIWGVVDVQHPDPMAEDAVRNAYLYLHSLKHLAANDPHWETNAEYHRIRNDFTTSLATAVR